MSLPAHWQTPETQVPPPHEWPHAPQLLGSVAVLTQVPLQSSGALAGQAHAPLMHEAPVAHFAPHAPQLLVSFARFAQTEPQLTSLVGQVQMPALHVEPVGQTLPHLPQLFASLVVLAQ